MSVLIWNIRGIGTESSVLYLKDIIRVHSPSVIGLLEPKHNSRGIGDFARKIGFEGYYHGEPINNHIWIFWRNPVQLREFTITYQCNSFYINWTGEGDVKMSMVYARCNRAERLDLWETLRQTSHTNDPWIVGGDFNIILNADEKRGGNPVDLRAIHDFRECVLDTGITEIDFEGDRFTWCNNQKGNCRIWERLDRCFANGEAIAQLPTLKCRHLTRNTSDHSPLLLSIQTPTKHKARFIFQKMWMEHPEFLPLVSRVWNSNIHGSPSFIVAEKLRRLQRHLKGWNWEVFGDIRTKLHETRCKIEDLEGRTQQAYVEEEAKELNMLKIEMTRLLKWETDILYQKTREKWVTEGDRNTKFFHALIKERRRRNTIKITNPDGSVLTDSQQILAGAVCHFQSLFTASPF